jgi:hypothetical protein
VPKNMVLTLWLTHLVIDLIHWLEYGVVAVAVVVATARSRGHGCSR